MGLARMGRPDAAIERLETALVSLESPELRALLLQLQSVTNEPGGG